MRIVRPDFIPLGLPRRVADCTATNWECKKQKVICSNVGLIQIVTQKASPKKPLPHEIIHEALDEVTEKKKIIVMHLNHARYDKDIALVAMVNRFREIGTEPLRRFVVNIRSLDKSESYICRFAQAEEQVKKAEPGSHLKEFLLKDHKIPFIFEAAIVGAGSISIGETGTYSLLSFGIFPAPGFPNGGIPRSIEHRKKTTIIGRAVA